MRSCALMLRDPATLLYSQVRERGQRAMFWAALTGRSRCLIALEEVSQACHISTVEHSQVAAQTRLVSIAQIVGSQNRCGDFDCDFNPLHDHNRARWLRIAAARRRGTPLPPVDLIQVGERYFVQDGHHRISVARALGQLDIEARVTVWQVGGPLPWDRQAGPVKQGAGKPSGQRTLPGQLYGKILAQVRTRKSDHSDGVAHVSL